MTFIQSVKTCFRKYFVFKGRATRSEFWWFQLFFWLILFGTVFVILLSGFEETDQVLGVALILEILLFFPMLSVTSRRLHDIGLSGWLQAPVVLIYLEDLELIISGLSDFLFVRYAQNAAMLFFGVILIICIKRGKAGANKYGPDPLAPDIAEVFN